MKKIFSINSITQKLGLLAKRFPISILLLVCLACLVSHLTNKSITYENIPYIKLFIFLSLGSVISVVVALWLENFVNYIKQHIITVAIVLLWGVYCFFIPIEQGEKYFIEKGIELLAIGIFVFLSFFFISFLKKDNNNAFWNFAVKTIFHFHLAVLFGSIIFIGLVAASFAIKNLFDIADIPKAIHINLAIIIYVLFVPIYFLANIPDKIAKQSEEIHFVLNKYSKIFALYILAPLAAIYTIILYAYLLKIIVALKLPEGLVSYLVSALACSGLFIISLLHPSRIEEKNKFIAVLSRYFGLIMLPLLTLMSIGIVRRIDDYGITIPRLYILLINVWFYGIFIYIFITKAKKIKPIFISFAVIILLSSLSFCGIPKITRSILTYESNYYLGNQKAREKEENEIKDMEKTEKELERIKIKIGKEMNRYEGERFYVYDMLKNKINYIDPSFNSFNNLDFCYTWTDIKNNTVNNLKYSSKKNELIIEVLDEKRIFSFPLKGLVHDLMEKKDPLQENKVFRGSDYTIFIENVHGRYDEKSNIYNMECVKGYLFYNKENAIKSVASFKNFDFSKEKREKMEIEEEMEIEKTEKEIEGKNRERFYGYNLLKSREQHANDAQYVTNFNVFVPLDYSFNSKKNKYQDKKRGLYINNDELMIEVKNNKLIIELLDEERIFSVPLKGLVQDLLEEKVPQSKDIIFQGEGYKIYISEFVGSYYKEIDKIVVSQFDGFLFYNK